jgi:hypothetical protein
MSVKGKLLAGAVALTMVSGVGAAVLTTSAASAATPACGGTCISIFSKMFDSHFVLDVYRQGQVAGQPVILWHASNQDPAEDFTFSIEGLVNEFYKAGLVSASFNLRYGGTEAVEIEYAPFGTNSGLCLGVAAAATAGEGVTLQPCGVSSKTVWAVDSVDVAWSGTFAPLINGTDTNFSHPFVLTYPGNSYPTDNPRPQLYVTNMTGFSQGFGGPELGAIQDKQMWNASLGVIP